MKAVSLYYLGTALALAAAVTLARKARAGRELVQFPERYADGVLYATANRGIIKEEIFTSRAAI